MRQGHEPGNSPIIPSTARLPRYGSHREPTVVLGLDGSQTSWRALAWAVGEADRLHGRVIAVLVSSTAAVIASDGLGTFTGFDPGGDDGCEQASAAFARELSGRAIQVGARAGVEVTFIHRWGETVDQLATAASASQADMIVVGSSTSLLHRIAGSVGRRLARRSRPIVVIVP